MSLNLKVIFALICVCWFSEAQKSSRGCPKQELILPCRCLLRDKEFQIWCSHSDLPRVLEGLRAVGQYIFQPIDELILENNNLPSLPGKTFLPLKVMRLMLRYNGLERVSSGWLSGLEDSLMELFVVEPELRSLPEESLQGQKALEAVTIQSSLMKRLPLITALPSLRYLQIESSSLLELSPRNFKVLPVLEKIHVSGSPRLEKIEAGTFDDLPNLKLLNISFCGINWIHLRSINRLPSLTELALIGNKINDAGMIGRAARNLPALEIIKLDFNEIEILAEAAFVDLPSLKKLFLGNNKISELHHGAFHRVPKLRTLDLSYNQVRRVHPESFLQHSGSGLEELWLMNNDISHVAELRALLDALPRLIFLDMSFNSLEAIPFGALRGHATLEHLNLDFNKIHVIDREAFMAMPALRELRLRNNSLTDRLETPLWNLPALKGLDLSGNYLRRLEPRLLSNIPSLRKVDLSGNEINIVDPTSFLLTPELENVNLSHNSLPAVHPATFRHLLKLYELDVSYNLLLEFVPGLPRGIEYLHMTKNLISTIPISPSPDLDLPALRMLEVSSNGIQRIPSGSLRLLPSLKRLYLGQNALVQIEEKSLTGLGQLEVLDLHQNRISKLHPNAFKEMSEVRELNLRENRLDILIPDVFHEIPNLKILDISRNQLTEILPGTLDNAQDIEVIFAAHNSLVRLPPGLYGMKKLRVLDLTNNRLKNIHPDTLNTLASLEDLKISQNFIQELRFGAFNNLRLLTSLELDNNEIIAIESKAITNLASLKFLKLNQNKLREIPNAAFSNLPSLQIIELQENELKLISPSAFHQASHVLMLNLSNNYLANLEDAGLRSLRSLEMLDLSNNQLDRISGSLDKMEWLVELHMDNNKICSVNGATFNGMPRLRVLSLKNNRMMTFPEHAVQKLRGNIAVLDIDGNPLACSCSILWLKAWLQEQSLMGPRCLDGSLLRDLRLSRQECQQNRENEPVAPGCEAELLTVPGPSETFTQHWMNLRDNRTKFEKNQVAPSPEESDYFYDEYIDYPYNLTENKFEEGKIKENSSHFISGDTPVIYAATKNKTKVPDTPKGVVGSPSSSGFTFFGLPLPNLNNILGGNVRMDDKKPSQAPKVSDVIPAERKAAIVNNPPRFQDKPFDFPERHAIMGMIPPTHPEIHTGFTPLLPGSGGFKPIIPEIYKKKEQKPQFGNVEKVNLTQTRSQSINVLSTLPPIIDPTNLPQNIQSVLSKRGPFLDQVPTTKLIPTTTSTTTTTTEMIVTTEEVTTQIELEDSEELEEYEEEDEKEEIDQTTARITEIEQIKNISQILKTTPAIETAPTAPGFESFEDIFKEVIDNVSIPPTATQPTQPEISHIENLHKPADLIPVNTENKAFNDSKVIGTPLSALLIPGGQQPQFRPSGRPSITKVQNPNTSSSPLVLEDELETGKLEDFITPSAHNREGKNGFSESTQAPNEDLNWYFANYNKTNLEPFVGAGQTGVGNGVNTGNVCGVPVVLAVFFLRYI